MNNFKKNIIYKKMVVFYILFFRYNRLLKKLQKNMQSEYYSDDFPKAHNRDKIIVYMADGRLHHGGLSDRLMGIVSTYEIAKQLGCKFKIYFTTPFFLSDYLIPNVINWEIEESELSYNIIDSLPVCLPSWGGSWEKKRQRQWLMKELSMDFKQIHVYTNAHFSLGKSYSDLFHELFKLSDILQNEIDSHLNYLGNSYLSLSFRFVQLLGDFVDDPTFPVLNETSRNRIMQRCLDKIIEIHEEYEDSLLFIASDSLSFLNAVKRLDYVYVIPGNPIHIDYLKDGGFEKHMKTFIDFFMISNAKTVFLLKTGKMYKSIFPYSASLINNAPFKLIEF